MGLRTAVIRRRRHPPRAAPTDDYDASNGVVVRDLMITEAGQEVPLLPKRAMHFSDAPTS